MIQKIMDFIHQFVPVLVGFPRWVQLFFFAVLLQVLVLIFVMLACYVFSQGRPAEKAGKTAQPSIPGTEAKTEAEQQPRTNLHLTAEKSHYFGLGADFLVTNRGLDTAHGLYWRLYIPTKLTTSLYLQNDPRSAFQPDSEVTIRGDQYFRFESFVPEPLYPGQTKQIACILTSVPDGFYRVYWRLTYDGGTQPASGVAPLRMEFRDEKLISAEPAGPSIWLQR